MIKQLRRTFALLALVVMTIAISACSKGSGGPGITNPPPTPTTGTANFRYRIAPQCGLPGTDACGARAFITVEKMLDSNPTVVDSSFPKFSSDMIKDGEEFYVVSATLRKGTYRVTVLDPRLCNAPIDGWICPTAQTSTGERLSVNDKPLPDARPSTTLVFEPAP